MNVNLLVRLPGRQSSWRGVRQDGAVPSGSSETPTCPAGTPLRGWTETHKEDTEPQDQSSGKAMQPMPYVTPTVPAAFCTRSRVGFGSTGSAPLQPPMC